MREKETQGLLAVWTNIEEGHRIEFRKWQNCQHIKERVTLPGFRVGHRYCGSGQAQDFLMLYETRDSKVMKSAPYLHSQNNPTPWTRESLTYFLNPKRSVYTVLARRGKKPPVDAPYIYVFRFHASPDDESEVAGWYVKNGLPGICSIQGVNRGRFYEMDLEVSTVATREKRIHGAAPVQQKFLALYEIESVDLPTSPEWEAAIRKDQRSDRIFGKLENVVGELFWIDFAMVSPRARSA